MVIYVGKVFDILHGECAQREFGRRNENLIFEASLYKSS